MSAPKFVHLRVHTAYSLSEGAIQVPALMHKCKEKNIASIAITDSANMFGGKAFSKYAKEEGIKPILGCQLYIRNPDADNPLKSKGRVIEPDKIILLVMNPEGYSNIMKLLKLAYLDGPNMEKPQILLEHLKDNNAGYIIKLTKANRICCFAKINWVKSTEICRFEAGSDYSCHPKPQINKRCFKCLLI
jgi:DNA polymerase-3 subunit alpha